MEELLKHKREQLNLIEKHIKKNGYKLTNPRKEILKLFIKNSQKHLSCEELYDTLKIKNIGISTIYRNMKLFKELDILKEIKLDEKNYYELKMFAKKPMHIHLRCEVCSQVIDVIDDEIILKFLKVNNLIEQKYKMEIFDADILIHGCCKKCKK